MIYYVIIPAYNEEGFLEKTLESLINQTLAPDKVIIVNDNSTDQTETIIDKYADVHSYIIKHNIISKATHLPGSKVVNAFTNGLTLLDDNYDFIVKLDADLILPVNYFEKISTHFLQNKNIGIAGGFAYEKNENGEWALNHPMNKDHVRGAFKAYKKECFKKIGGLKKSIGWDTVDELLANYHGFLIYTDASLKVKHLRPTGKSYPKKARHLQGEAMYKMRYGLIISIIASIKMMISQKRMNVFWNNIYGFLKAWRQKQPYVVSAKEGKFIRQYRTKGILQKLNPF